MNIDHRQQISTSGELLSLQTLDFKPHVRVNKYMHYVYIRYISSLVLQYTPYWNLLK